MIKLFFGLFVSIFLLQSCSNSKDITLEVFFIELETNIDAGLRGLHVIDENVVWASGSKGTVLFTEDGGKSWHLKSIQGAEENDFRSIYAWNEKRAIVFGVSGPEFGYITENGGETWEVVYRDTAQGLFFNSLKFADDKNGLAVSDPVDGKFVVLKTEDSGITWERITDLPAVEEGEANFAASNTCIEFLPSGKAWFASGGKAARVFYSHDFGKSWEVSNTPMIRGQASAGIFSIEFRNDDEGVVVGGIYDQPEINSNIASYTFDGGINWILSETMPLEYRSCVQNISLDKTEFLFAIGKTGCDYSGDGGNNWQFLNKSGFYTFRAVKGEPYGFASGANGKISKVVFTKVKNK